MKTKIPVNFDNLLKYSAITAILLMIISLVFRFRTLTILAEFLVAATILALIVTAIYSLLEKYSPQNKNETKEKESRNTNE